MFTTVEVAKPARAVLTDPSILADALLRLEVEFAVGGAVRKALACLLVQGRAVGSLPALLADAGAVNAEAVAGARRIGAVDWRRKKFFLKLANRRIFFIYFRLFKETIFTTNKCEKCPFSLRCWDSNPWHLKHESPPTTTRPGLPSGDEYSSLLLFSTT